MAFRKRTPELTGWDTNDEDMGILNPPPQVSGLPDTSLANGEALYFCLNPYVTDNNDKLITLMWTGEATSSFIEVLINNDNKWCTIIARDYIGEVDVILTATDPFEDSDSDTMHIVVTGQTAVNDFNNAGIPDQFILNQNFPNPFNPETTISFGLPEAAEVTITIYDMMGKRIEELWKGRKEQGFHSLTWNALDCPSGVYFIRMQADKFTQMKKCVLMK